MDFKTGGQQIILRLVEAYGFSTRQMLCDHLGVSKSTLATRFMRDIFPAEWVIQCALETGVSLQWLTKNEDPMYLHGTSDVLLIPHMRLINGTIHNPNSFYFDKCLLPSDLTNPLAISFGEIIYIATYNFSEINDGKWLIKFDGKASIRDIISIPGNKIIVNDGNFSFECNRDDIEKVASIKKY